MMPINVNNQQRLLDEIQQINHQRHQYRRSTGLHGRSVRSFLKEFARYKHQQLAELKH